MRFLLILGFLLYGLRGCNPEPVQEIDIETASSAELYSAYKQELRRWPPHDDSLATVMAERDMIGLEMMIADLRNGDRSIRLGYNAIIGAYLRQGHLEICKPGELNSDLREALELFYEDERLETPQERTGIEYLELHCAIYLELPR